jgi:hypothetical protein
VFEPHFYRRKDSFACSSSYVSYPLPRSQKLQIRDCALPHLVVGELVLELSGLDKELGYMTILRDRWLLTGLA